MSFARGYSLWLQPEEKKYKVFSDLISKLQRQVNEPVFAPHITVISGLNLKEPEIIKRAEILAKTYLPIYIQLNNAVWGYTFFQRYYFTIRTNDDLIKLHKAALQMFGEIEMDSYQPHMSLQYADYTRIPDEQILSNIKPYTGKTIEFSELQVMKTNGPIKEWKSIKSFISRKH